MCREQGKLLKLDKGMEFIVPLCNVGHFPYIYKPYTSYKPYMKWETQGLQTRLELQGQLRLCPFSGPGPDEPFTPGNKGWE